jgi:hypothetical protein
MGPIERASLCLPFLAQFLEDINLISCQHNIYNKRLLLFYDVRSDISPPLPGPPTTMACMLCYRVMKCNMNKSKSFYIMCMDARFHVSSARSLQSGLIPTNSGCNIACNSPPPQITLSQLYIFSFFELFQQLEPFKCSLYGNCHMKKVASLPHPVYCI